MNHIVPDVPPKVEWTAGRCLKDGEIIRLAIRYRRKRCNHIFAPPLSLYNSVPLVYIHCSRLFPGKHTHKHTPNRDVIVLAAHSSEYAAHLKPSWPSLLSTDLEANAPMHQPLVHPAPTLTEEPLACLTPLLLLKSLKTICPVIYFFLLPSPRKNICIFGSADICVFSLTRHFEYFNAATKIKAFSGYALIPLRCARCRGGCIWQTPPCIILYAPLR